LHRLGTGKSPRRVRIRIRKPGASGLWCAGTEVSKRFGHSTLRENGREWIGAPSGPSATYHGIPGMFFLRSGMRLIFRWATEHLFLDVRPFQLLGRHGLLSQLCSITGVVSWSLTFQALCNQFAFQTFGRHAEPDEFGGAFDSSFLPARKLASGRWAGVFSGSPMVGPDINRPNSFGPDRT